MLFCDVIKLGQRMYKFQSAIDRAQFRRMMYDVAGSLNASVSFF